MDESVNGSADDAAGDELRDTLRLTLVPGVGPRTRRTLLERFGSPRAVLAAAPSELRDMPGVGPKLTEKILHAEQGIDVDAEIAALPAAGHRNSHRIRSARIRACSARFPIRPACCSCAAVSNRKTP